jgi:hypothetical protein
VFCCFYDSLLVSEGEGKGGEGEGNVLTGQDEHRLELCGECTNILCRGILIMSY